ncbi:tyrosine-type recombinase/integrase [Rhizobium ruizarguesonis]|uniref:tyrosine-type recombinase/integrase n=1 Tax=Rhizobium ruizarguesonis TaxID=2081791 RepID=UPI0010303C92|nr:tyrosine-type recombinase/integrase [Rhizobium ruizarguesonis]TBF31481.1 site-specific integrase [Rhizobium ruizarguesonis]
MARSSSNKAKGVSYLERLIDLRERSEAAGTTVENGSRVRRSWLVTSLGCSDELISSNPKIRRAVLDWDNVVAERRRTAAVIASEMADCGVENEVSNVIAMPRNSKRSKPLHGKIRWNTISDAAGNEHRVPIVIDGTRIDENPSNWCRYLTIVKGLDASSVEVALNVYRPFKEFIRKHGFDELEVNDEVFLLWKHSLLRTVEANRVNTCLKTIHSYYRYLEETGVVRFRVQIYETDDLPPTFKPPYTFPITSKRVIRKSELGIETRSWTTPYGVRGTTASRSTPTNEHAKKAHARTKTQKHGVRNSILLSLAETTGGRISELLQIKLSQLPDPARLAEIIQTGQPYQVFVKRKRRGKKDMPLVLTKYLLIRIVNYVEKERMEIVKRFPKTAGKSDYLFLGDRGNDLRADSVTHLVLELFFGILADAGIHRLRSKFAVDRLETLISAALEKGIDVGPNSNWVEQFLQIVSEEMGQASILSLRPYLPLVFGRRLATTQAVLLREQELRAIETERLIADQELRIQKQMETLRLMPSLQEAARLIAENNKLDARDYLRDLANQLDPAQAGT